MRYFNSIKNGINKTMDKTIGIFEMAVLGIIVISTLSYALAWQAPGGNPPVGNTDSPLNTGSTGQAKSGGLILNTGGAATGLIVQNGNVGIGTTAPESKLHIKTGTDQNIKFSAFVNSSNGTALTASNDIATNKNTFEIIASNILLTPTGNVGIGTTNPSQKLDVRGDIKLGTSGELYAVGGVERLKIIRGTINANGTIRMGTGFSVNRLAAGYYRVNFDTAFSAAPTIIVSAVGAAGPGDGAPWFQTANLRREDEYMRTTSQFEVVLHYQQLGGTSDTSDRPWDFIAIGY